MNYIINGYKPEKMFNFFEAAATVGASVLEKRYGLERWRKRSITSFLPEV